MSDNNEITALLSAILEGQQTTNARLDSIDSRLDKMDTRLSNLESDVSTIKGNVDSIERSQKMQEKALGTIAIRTLAHDADLSELKKAE
ncbi:hypothetical protein IC619_015360 [Hazenella sp. IB182353]|uniref:hypothetical protein n=1 Tax=Polycladospora coralii TaxID=2771432 RepID=UPI0017465DE9|nr:hypothetical protein [Polycladospora coralii]MBS7531850.1 hypothetical protein [Polycladospora coralii]